MKLLAITVALALSGCSGLSGKWSCLQVDKPVLLYKHLTPQTEGVLVLARPADTWQAGVPAEIIDDNRYGAHRYFKIESQTGEIGWMEFEYGKGRGWTNSRCW